MTSRPVRAHLGREQAAEAGGWWGRSALEDSLHVPRARQADRQQAGTVYAFVWFRIVHPSYSHHQRSLPFLPSGKSKAKGPEASCEMEGEGIEGRGLGRGPPSLLETCYCTAPPPILQQRHHELIMN